ncbi:MurR/RpiR family transcriptional regulator [Dyella sp.]|jgi:DNA-binding MurR/RpiR family transcriptional regulator|uniref:MurR/RpiR family transcriptional regulator n=1 Tax=Dyella sp. TaxID=1869338 RepID=UPI002D766227|nr:MurR/RpiR family transcriptional regulator [Dyella sp.]HET6430990.1 MurR/RpiR family transcriptional regulator [Dyella sp.]
MIKDLQKKLKSRWDTFTTSEQKIATYLLHDLSAIPFETAASLGERVGVSPMTVGRFLRNLGYAGLNELKAELREDSPWLQLYNNPARAGGADALSESLQADIRALTAAHALVRTPQWEAIVNMLVAADRVSVASFHHGRFFGLGFASLLQHVKPRTSFADGLDGAYADVLLDSTANSCLVLIDFRRYSRHFRILAEEAVARRIPLAIITDTQCYWARQLTDNVLMLPIDPALAWHNFGPVTSLLSLLTGSVIKAQGEMFERIGDITQLRQKFVGYVEAPTPAKGAGARSPGKPAAGKGGAARRPRGSKPAG